MSEETGQTGVSFCFVHLFFFFFISDHGLRKVVLITNHKFRTQNPRQILNIHPPVPPVIFHKKQKKQKKTKKTQITMFSSMSGCVKYLPDRTQTMCVCSLFI